MTQPLDPESKVLTTRPLGPLYFKVKFKLIEALSQKSVQEKESIISVRYEQTNMSLGSLFGIIWQSLVMPEQ